MQMLLKEVKLSLVAVIHPSMKDPSLMCLSLSEDIGNLKWMGKHIIKIKIAFDMQTVFIWCYSLLLFLKKIVIDTLNSMSSYICVW